MTQNVDQEIFSDSDICRWRVGNADEVVFPIDNIVEDGSNRLVEQERPFRDGAKVDDTGGKARRWRFDAIFNNTLDEPGLESNGGDTLYPTVLRKVIESFDQHQTGDLRLPTVGIVRARAASYSRQESSDARDEARLSLMFVEDNEDALDRASLSPPTVITSAVRLAEQTQFSAQSAGAWDEDLNSFSEFAADLEGLLLAPGRTLDDVTAQVRRNRRAVQRIQNAQEQAAEDVGGLFNDPAGSEPVRQLRAFGDRSALAEEERTSGRPRTIDFVVDVRVTNIFAIAARFNQDAEELLELNGGRIEDPFAILQGDVVRVFETTP